VLATEPRSVSFRRELARTNRMFSDLDVPLSEKLEHVRASVSLVEQLRREVPANTEIQNELAISEYGMATCLQTQSRFPDAMTYFRKALADTPPSRSENLALYHKRLGALLVVAKDLPAALAEYQAAVAIDEHRVAIHPDDARARMDLSFGYSDIGLICQFMGKLREGLEYYRQAERIRAEVSTADPRDQRAAYGLGVTTLRIGELLEIMGYRSASEAALRHGIELGESYRNRFPQSRDAHSLLADAYRVFGRAYQRSWSSCDKAQTWLDRAEKLYREDANTNGLNLTAQIRQACRQ
jgi:tetratricopeptide (TPR) repeat protein